MAIHHTAVLVVEDEALVRMAIAGELEEAGFEVFEAANASEAIELLIAHTQIEVLFTVIDMPGGVDGIEFAAAVRERWPSIKIIATSGHRRVDIDTLPVEARFMAKPYNPDLVILAIMEMVATGSSP
ncbi:response regulator [Rhizobium lusitanum]|uniref:Response regulator n=1 Tax=Rhizobium lusitanum TaxID=293958 RepID=A0A6L9UEN1_9HYPH|nr:response regulator [Rhizobium lusitanum]NEI74443.1 response regulator [Rhizobium lusitanum]